MSHLLFVIRRHTSRLPHRCEKVLYGHQHSFEQNLLRCDWSPDGNRVAAGSADRIVYVWDAGESDNV